MLQADQSHSSFEGYPSFYSRDDAGKTLITSTVDFCEANFQHTSFIAEPANTISSLVYCLISISHLYFTFKYCYGKKNRFYWRFVLSSVCSMILGLGSALLHCTLTRFFQYFDEIPMVVAVMLGIHMFLLRNKEDDECLWYNILVSSVLTFVTVGHSISTIWVSDSYSIFVYVFAALLNISTLLEALHVYRGNNLEIWFKKVLPHASQEKIDACSRNVRRVYLIYFVFFLVAFILWAIEFYFCPNVYFLYLHVFWHIMTAIAANAKSTLWKYMTLLGHGVEEAEMTYYDPFRTMVKLDIKEKSN
ncbi:predicted protein [Naegleria gruberi]|uniref:Predicted protein n=1 Tax=Naegleria gruberi TaxID=5762 RepID=D2UXC5_NAEGR|nr:uncharacterized protein NAEGRDRAFT_61076 [Naegleria gruberi]EFC50609.1 predicted protein [Naegleria gruberi]|eukprot:XP_002683353.1 predicted protein [Naegleria gruberi strain NEG-M]